MVSSALKKEKKKIEEEMNFNWPLRVVEFFEGKENQSHHATSLILLPHKLYFRMIYI